MQWTNFTEADVVFSFDWLASIVLNRHFDISYLFIGLFIPIILYTVIFFLYWYSVKKKKRKKRQDKKKEVVFI